MGKWPSNIKSKIFMEQKTLFRTKIVGGPEYEVGEGRGKCNSKYFTATFSEPKLMYSSFKNPLVVAFSSPTIQLSGRQLQLEGGAM